MFLLSCLSFVSTWSLPNFFQLPLGRNAESVIKQKYFEMSTPRSQLLSSSWYANVTAFPIKRQNLFWRAVKKRLDKCNHFLMKYSYSNRLNVCLCFSSPTQLNTTLCFFFFVCIWLSSLKNSLALVAIIHSIYSFNYNYQC